MSPVFSGCPVVRQQRAMIVTCEAGRGKRPIACEADILWLRQICAKTVFVWQGRKVADGTTVSDWLRLGQGLDDCIETARDTARSYAALRDWAKRDPEVVAWVREFPVLHDESSDAFIHNSGGASAKRYGAVPEGARLLEIGMPVPDTRLQFRRLPELKLIDSAPGTVFRVHGDESENRRLRFEFDRGARRDLVQPEPQNFDGMSMTF